MPQNGWHFPFFFLGTAVAGARATFSALSGAPVCVRKPYSLALRAVVRKPCRRPGHLFAFFRHRVRARKPNSLALQPGEREPNRGPGRFFCSLSDRNRRKGFSYICRKMCRLRFQKIFCRYSNFSGLCSRNSSKGLFNDFSETFQVRTTF